MRDTKFITLYVATHNVTGKKYFGKSQVCHTIDDLISYGGSGVYWNLHLNKHGKDISMEILYQSSNIELIKSLALMYSKFWNIVDSKDYANLVEETGFSGGDTRSGKVNSDEHRKKISESNKGKRALQSTRDKMSHTRKGVPKSDIHKQRISDAQHREPQPKVECPHCGVVGGHSVMYRHHFKNCKTNKRGQNGI